jgi:hypothetical protein
MHMHTWRCGETSQTMATIHQAAQQCVCLLAVHYLQILYSGRASRSCSLTQSLPSPLSAGYKQHIFTLQEASTTRRPSVSLLHRGRRADHKQRRRIQAHLVRGRRRRARTARRRQSLGDQRQRGRRRAGGVVVCGYCVPSSSAFWPCVIGAAGEQIAHTVACCSLVLRNATDVNGKRDCVYQHPCMCVSIRACVYLGWFAIHEPLCSHFWCASIYVNEIDASV